MEWGLYWPVWNMTNLAQLAPHNSGSEAGEHESAGAEGAWCNVAPLAPPQHSHDPDWRTAVCLRPEIDGGVSGESGE